jgi:carbohydrate-selective porin OprB
VAHNRVSRFTVVGDTANPASETVLLDIDPLSGLTQHNGGAIHFGRFDFSVDGDLEKLFGWTGGRFYANALGLYGRGLSRNYVHNLATISEIEALPEARLYNAYFEQGFYNNALNISNAISGPGSATINIFPSVQYNGTAANTYTGKTIVQSGTLILNKPAGTNAIGASGNPAGDIVMNGGTLRWDASNQIIDGGGIVNSNGILNVNGKTDTLAAMTMDNVGAQTLTGTNGSITFTNQATLYRGTLNVAAGGSLTANTFSLGDGNASAIGNIFGTLNIGAGGGQTFDSFGGTLTQLTVRSGGLIQTDGGLFLLRGMKSDCNLS